MVIRDSRKRITDTITRTANTTAYDIGDVIGGASSILEFENAGEGLKVILGARLMIAVNAVPSGMTTFTLHLYNASPTNIADNAAWALPSADSAKYLGSFQFTAPVDLGDVLVSQKDGLNMTVEVKNNTASLYGFLETDTAYTPASATVHTISLDIE